MFLDFGLATANDVPKLLNEYVYYYNYERPAAALGYKRAVQYKTERASKTMVFFSVCFSLTDAPTALVGCFLSFKRVQFCSSNSKLMARSFSFRCASASSLGHERVCRWMPSVRADRGRASRDAMLWTN